MGPTCVSDSKHANSENKLIRYNYGENGVEYVLKQAPISVGKWFLCCLCLATCVVGVFFQEVLPKWSAWVPVVLLLVLVWKLTLIVTEESILVLRSCGLQVKTTYLIGRSATQFVDMAQVKDIVINEGIRMHQVICYLSVLLTPRPGSDENGLFPLFMNSLPKVGVLREIYGGVKPLLVRRGD